MSRSAGLPAFDVNLRWRRLILWSGKRSAALQLCFTAHEKRLMRFPQTGSHWDNRVGVSGRKCQSPGCRTKVLHEHAGRAILDAE